MYEVVPSNDRFFFFFLLNSLLPGLVDPGDRDPLGGCTHKLDGFLQVPDGFIDLIVDNC